MNNPIKDKLNNLTEEDTYSLILFALYKLTDIPEYSTISELSYILDKDSLLKVISYFGGSTIKVPTLDDLKLIANCLLLIQYTLCDNISFDIALNKIDNDIDKDKLKQIYVVLCNVLKEYNFGHKN